MWKLKFKTIPFTITPKKFKYLSIPLEYVQNLSAEKLQNADEIIKDLNK